MPTQDPQPKIGYVLSVEQKKAIRDFINFCKDPKKQAFNNFLLTSLWARASEHQPDMLKILEETSSFINSDQDLSFLDPTSNIEIDRNLERKITDLFLSAQFLIANTIDGYEAAQSNQVSQARGPSNSKIKLDIKQKAHSLVIELSRESQSYQQKISAQQNSYRLLSEANESIIVKGKLQPTLIDILFKAIHHPGVCYKLAKPQVKLIKDSFGQEQFDALLKRYQIKEENFNFDDLRMLIIGALPSAKKTWFENEFIKNLCICCNLATERYKYASDKDKKMLIKKAFKNLEARASSCKTADDASNLIYSLIKETVISGDALERIKTAPVDTTVNNALNFFKNFIDCIPIRSRLNTKFRRDLNAFEAITSISNWQNKQNPEIQKFASNEFLFNKLSHVDLQDDAVIPILEADGKRIFYRVKNLTNISNIKAFALVPENPRDSQEIKVVFNGNSNLAKEIINAENYMSIKDFEANKEEILSKLDTVVKNFKAELHQKAPSVASKLCLNAGGHGFRGALAQQLTNEIVFRKAAKKYKEHPQEFDLESYAERQIEHETKKLGKKIKNPEKYKQQIVDAFKQKIDNHQIASNDTNLLAINNFKLSTINSGGIPEKMRANQFVPSLHLLKDKKQKTPFNIEYNKTMTVGDPVQQTGETDLAAYVPRELMKVNLAKIRPKTNSSNLQLVANITKSAALIVIQGLVAAQVIVIPQLFSFFSISIADEAKNILENSKQLIQQANKAHRGLHFDKMKPPKNHEIYHNDYMDDDKNAYNTTGYRLNKELVRKVKLFSSKPYKLLNKAAYKACQLLQSKTPRISSPHEEFHHYVGITGPMPDRKDQNPTIQQPLSSIPKPQKKV